MLIKTCLVEPHEICGEENYGSVVWKKTPAGDTAAVSCPSDASGTELSVLNVGHGLILMNECINHTLPDSCRPDPAQMHSGRRRSSLLGEPNSRQMHLQGIPEHPDSGKLHLLVLHIGVKA